MSAPEPLYPFALEPIEKELIWGGTALRERYNKSAPAAAKIGESWECYDASSVRNGAFAGATVAELCTRLGRDFTGRADPAHGFPLLTKLIDARQALSVQVHPSDAYAQRVEHQRNGKTECWVILEADPGSEIVLGWTRETTRDEYLERVRTGTLDDILRRVPVKAGDAYHLPAGTLHAIGAGIVLFETQQTSDLTYRIYDYGRLGPDGKPRALHVDKAADVLSYARETRAALEPLAYELAGLRRTALVADRNFVVERVELSREPCGLDLDEMPLIVQALGTPVTLSARGAAIRLAPYETAVLPAALDVVMVGGDVDGDGAAGSASFLTAAPPRDHDALDRRFDRAGVSDIRAAEFLAQFTS